MICRPVVADLDHFDEEQDTDPHQSENLDPDPYQSENMDPDPHHGVSDPQQGGGGYYTWDFSSHLF
jgi:hypothetical protein